MIGMDVSEGIFSHECKPVPFWPACPQRSLGRACPGCTAAVADTVQQSIHYYGVDALLKGTTQLSCTVPATWCLETCWRRAASPLHLLRYLQGLLAGRDDIQLMRQTGGIRDINRHRYTVEEARQEATRPVVQVRVAGAVGKG